MAWSRIAKTASVFVLLGLGLYGAFLAGQLYSNAGPWVQMHSNAGPWARTVGENPLVEMDEIPEHASQEMLKHFFPTGESPDGRFGTKCFKDYHGVEYCSVPLSRLAAFPERYQGRHIITTGFLRALGSTLLILFPSADGTMERSAFETLLIMPRAFPHELESRV